MVFQKGHEIVCVNAAPLNNMSANHPPLIKGKHYTIIDIRYCQKCGRMQLNIGVKAKGKGWNFCAFCERATPADDIHWCSASRFAPIPEIPKEHFDAIKDLVEQSKISL